MSQPSQKSKLIIAMTGAVIVVAATWSVRHPSDANGSRSKSRMPSSINNSLRLETTKQSRLDQFANTEQIGKVSGSFAVSIRGDDGNGGSLEKMLEKMNDAASRVRLHGVVTADRPVTGHEYSWILPTGYRASDGNLTGMIPDLQPGQMFDISITVDRGQIPLQPIVLHVFKLVNSEARGQVAQFDIPDAKSTKEAAERSSRAGEDERKYVQ